MQGPGMRVRARRAGLALAALACAAAVGLPAEAGVPGQSMDLASSGLGAERVKTIPIARNPGAKPRVVMSLPPDKVGDVDPGDAVYASAEVEVSTTCLEPMPKCVGRIYHFSPYYRARLVLAPSADAAKPASTTPISGWRKQRCSQKLPNRNHHCVLALSATRSLKEGADLPCDRCHVNLVVEAYHGSARRGHVLVVGSDSDDGIRQDKGMINSAVWSPGPRPAIAPVVQDRRRVREVPIGSQGGGGMRKTVVFSRRLNDLRAGEKLLIEARIKARTGHLPYGVLLQSQVVISEKPGSTRRAGIPNKAVSGKGMITAQNGFNCTRGPSGHRSPCVIRKLGVARMLTDARSRPVSGQGPFQPLYVNLFIQSKAEFNGHRHRPGHAVKIARRGLLSVHRYE